MDILTDNKIGYALWNFRGDFGLLDSRREDVEYQEWRGHKLDGKPIQPLTIVHGERYVYYSHGVRLVKGEMEVDGKKMDADAVLRDAQPVIKQKDRRGATTFGPAQDRNRVLKNNLSFRFVNCFFASRRNTSDFECM